MDFRVPFEDFEFLYEDFEDLYENFEDPYEDFEAKYIRSKFAIFNFRISNFGYFH